MVYERNLKLLKASEANPEKANPKKVAEFRSLVGQASEYLSMLEQRLADVRTLPAHWRAMADRHKDTALAMFEQVARADTPAQAQSVKAPECRNSPALAVPACAKPPQPKDVAPSSEQPAKESRQDVEIRRMIARIYEKAASEKEAPPPERPQRAERNPKRPPTVQQQPPYPHPGFDRGW
jgi:hypothetical protein